MAKEVNVPDELKILLPELNKGVIVVGNKGYEMFPLYEGQFEKILSDVMAVMDKVTCPDGKCETCEKVIKNAGPRRIWKCPDDGGTILTMNQAPMEAIVGSGKIPLWIEMVTGIPQAEVAASITLDQQKHFAGLFWRQNFSEDGLPEASKANFQKLLGMMSPGGPGQEKKSSPTVTENTKPQE